MKAFFQKHPVDLDELTAVKMIRKKMESAELKCETQNEEYLNDLAKAYEMIEDFFTELESTPSSYL